MVPPIQPTRPAIERRVSSPSLKSSRDLISAGDQISSCTRSSPRVEEDIPEETEGISGQSAELQHCESILSTIQKETVQNGNRYITMLEFKELTNPALDEMQQFVKTVRRGIDDLEKLCANGWDNDDIDAILETIPSSDLATVKHLWES